MHSSLQVDPQEPKCPWNYEYSQGTRPFKPQSFACAFDLKFFLRGKIVPHAPQMLHPAVPQVEVLGKASWPLHLGTLKNLGSASAPLNVRCYRLASQVEQGLRQSHGKCFRSSCVMFTAKALAPERACQRLIAQVPLFELRPFLHFFVVPLQQGTLVSTVV
jgi:hypothetical protein